MEIAFALASLNPLHCGAVVASSWRRGSGLYCFPVSIPFIAGQWSLQFEFGPGQLVFTVSQSPSLRGSGRFWLTFCQLSNIRVVSQSPSLRGSGRFVAPWLIQNALIPLSQSPSLRGSGRFK